MKPAKSIKDMVLDQKVVLFMKGAPGDSPCGFSTRLCSILDHVGVDYSSIDVLESEDIRRGVKAFSGIKTLPQLFMSGVYVGGSDDIRKLYEDNQLSDFLKARDIHHQIDPAKPRLDLGRVSREEIISCAQAGKDLPKVKNL